MEEENKDSDYSSVIETLCSAFGEVLSKDDITSIVEKCQGNVYESADAIMSITSEANKLKQEEKSLEAGEDSIRSIQLLNNPIENSTTKEPQNIYPEECTPQGCDDLTAYDRPSTSYDSPSTSKIVPKQMSTSMQDNKRYDDVKKILNYHMQGIRTLIVMRGVPGSGKTYLAKHILDKIYKTGSFQFYSRHIFSADDFFRTSRGAYKFDKSKLPQAHYAAQKRAFHAMIVGLSPVIVDNTNIEIWEMKPYIVEGVKNGYSVILLEPNTPWAWKINQLVERNVHRVSGFTLRRMLDNYQHGLTGPDIIKRLGCIYPFDMKAPIARNYPPLSDTQTTTEYNLRLQNEEESAPIDYKKISDYYEARMRDSFRCTQAQLNSLYSNKADTPVQKVSHGTCVEDGDTNIKKGIKKIMIGIARDINQFYVGSDYEKNPDILMLDKSTTTNEVKCKNEAKHYTGFKKLFKNICEPHLHYVFDLCSGDVNEAIGKILGDVNNRFIQLKHDRSESDSESENSNDEIPDQNVTAGQVDQTEFPTDNTNTVLPGKKKRKRQNLTSKIKQSSVKKYSVNCKNCLIIRNLRRGVIDYEDNISEFYFQVYPEARLNRPARKHDFDIAEYSDDDTASIFNDVEETISIDVRKDLISQLDKHFGWSDMIYSKKISTKINVPISILHQINALWIESLLYQLAENEKQIKTMIKQDEEFASDLFKMEQEMVRDGKEPGVPDLKEIMDMDLALSLYQKDVDKWQDNQPQDLAAILTRQKLIKIFPEFSPAILSEMLMAHDNNFQETVESLLVSTGKSDILESDDGIAKFVIEKQTEQEKLYREQNEAFQQNERPSLDEDKAIDMSVVHMYRDMADNHLKARNVCHKKAEELVRRGMIPAASYYKDHAEYHKKKYEYYNSRAAGSLMQIHSVNNPDGNTVDLHYLHVQEAKQALDMFLDKHIQRMKDKNESQCRKLYIITGRGLHSDGRPKVKPAAKKRLKQRGIECKECNPGLLQAKVFQYNKFTDDLC